ncbi:mannitol dehydrogenase family protein [Qingshengfaniella alkalisoli]|uniref:Mannitol dehydrogenase family protein n=1 Tax=Qingshengfaniella alkalisoli TaxID=2599296 RepID=A0A5B8IY93_9RHOB|nr:mannitol dehydrogenase family protein [Qingshengfaniella alkalisoli]QDY71112.1 mannitol dehydrogenase family protein [Qingshengfaniella alkalisoli]
MPTKLSLSTLDDLSDKVARPNYAREDLSAGIVHIGVGNFHRAHQAVYLDRLFSTGCDHDWAIIGAGIMPGDAAMRERLAAQDYLTTVVEQSADVEAACVTGPMIDFLPVGDTGAIIDALCRPEIRIASLTITEGGYFVDAGTGHFDPGHPAIVADVVAGDRPGTVFGVLVTALRIRRERDIPPFTVMSCDNLPHNGRVCFEAVTGLARLIDPELADWIVENVAFPNGMVDRITPATGERERRITSENFGISDGWPVFCEDFIQWVLEDKFTMGRPALEAVGVQFVPDVTPYEMMKIRILNGGHAVIAYPAGLLDIHFVHEAMEDPLIAAFLDKIEADEIIPQVPPVPDTDLDGYYRIIRTRFANPKIGDTVRRLCLDGSNRQPKFIIPTIRDRIAEGRDVRGLALGSALWCRYCHGETESGAVIAPNDPNWDRLVAAARAARTDPAAWLAMDDIYGSLGQSAPFRDEFSRAVRALWADGTRAVLESYVKGIW